MSTIITCPNEHCGQNFIKITYHHSEPGDVRHTPSAFESYKLIDEWQLCPDSLAKTFPDYIPSPILQDYNEACLIINLSPKASSALSRRCLQGIIRDYWKIQKNTLYEEINALEAKIPGDAWAAIDSLRKIGNIGAHFEKDVNLIIEVTVDEAQTLISLIEFLFKEWYVKKHEHESNLQKIVSIAKTKETERKIKD